MNESTQNFTDTGEEVMRATGELSATVKETVKSVAASDVSHEEVQGWLTTIFKSLLAALGK